MPRVINKLTTESEHMQFVEEAATVTGPTQAGTKPWADYGTERDLLLDPSRRVSRPKRSLTSVDSTSKTTTIRVGIATRDMIAQLAEQEGKSMTAVVDDAVREHRRRLRWERVAEQ